MACVASAKSWVENDMLEKLLLDVRGHHPGCPKHGKDEPLPAEEQGSNIDLFCDCYDFKEPLLLTNGTGIAWPAGWTQEEADAWRLANGLENSEIWKVN
jgi:hypothetical protein